MATGEWKAKENLKLVKEVQRLYQQVPRAHALIHFEAAGSSSLDL
jgi:hypothetical protein